MLVEEALRAQVPVLDDRREGRPAEPAARVSRVRPEPFVPWVDGDARRATSARPRRSPRELAARARERPRALAHRRARARGLPRDARDVRVITPGSLGGRAAARALVARAPLAALGHRPRVRARRAQRRRVARACACSGATPIPRGAASTCCSPCSPSAGSARAAPPTSARCSRTSRNPPIDAHRRAARSTPSCPKRERRALAAALNTLLASPTFASWRKGATLDVGEWLDARSDGRTPAVIVSVAHLDDEERALVLGVLLEEVLSWVRSLPGTQRLRALVVFDEVYGFLPPHPANPPTKRPLVALMKQARAFGVGVVVATQNPMDLDYRALSNAGLWCVGRLQTDADRPRDPPRRRRYLGEALHRDPRDPPLDHRGQASLNGPRASLASFARRAGGTPAVQANQFALAPAS